MSISSNSTMASCRLVLIALVLCVSYARGLGVPAFIWGDISPSPPLGIDLVSGEKFADILTELAPNNEKIIIFVEDTLSPEDLSHDRNSFPYLHSQISQSVYLPSVEDVFSLNHISSSVERVNIGAPDVKPNGKILIVDLNDAKSNEKRTTTLRRHDKYMQDTMDKLRNDGEEIVAIYTGQGNYYQTESHNRQKRQVASNDTADHMLNGLRLAFANVRLTEDGNTQNLNGIPTSTSEIAEDNMNVTLTFGDNSLLLKFRSASGYWFFENVVVSNVDLNPVEEVFAPLDFSYRCAQNVGFSSSNSSRDISVTFEDLKVQPFFRQTNASVQYGDSYNCVGFFTAPIWAGLFVVFLLLFITFYGIVMMLDIKTMDRFDDPKGKTITINAAE